MEAVQLTLFEHERQIEHALLSVEASWVVIATHLRAIHEQVLYKSEYGTWARYCQDRWGKTREWGRLQVKAAEVFENANYSWHGELPENEQQIRPLVGLPPGIQAEVWQDAVGQYGKPTGLQVAALADIAREEYRQRQIEGIGPGAVVRPAPNLDDNLSEEEVAQDFGPAIDDKIRVAEAAQRVLGRLINARDILQQLAAESVPEGDAWRNLQGMAVRSAVSHIVDAAYAIAEQYGIDEQKSRIRRIK